MTSLFALPKSRRKTANLNRDPRAAVVIFDAANPYESVQVQGTASIAVGEGLPHRGQPGLPGQAEPGPTNVGSTVRTASTTAAAWTSSCTIRL